jgi:hypothetical protein
MGEPREGRKSNLRLIGGGPGDDSGRDRDTVAGAPRDGFKTAVLQELYTRYGGSVYGRCRYLLRDPMKAEDAMQDVFAKALTGMPGFRAEASPLTWLMTIATHHCLNLLRADRARDNNSSARSWRGWSGSSALTTTGTCWAPARSRIATRSAGCSGASISKPKSRRSTITSTR